jgi:ABC-type dipeptide/oligopeptide/nickel transport system ATPase subunit
MVFQDPREALNPFRSIGQSVGEPLRQLSEVDCRHRVATLLSHMGLDPTRAAERPSAFSGGQLQRVVIARALAPSPQVLLCDEPTSSLDVSVQAQIVNLLLQLQQEHGFACVLVTHDLTVARVLADDVLVLRRGVVVEHSPSSRFFTEPAEDYSRGLLDAVARQSLARRELRVG